MAEREGTARLSCEFCAMFMDTSGFFVCWLKHLLGMYCSEWRFGVWSWTGADSREGVFLLFYCTGHFMAFYSPVLLMMFAILLWMWQHFCGLDSSLFFLEEQAAARC